jgi:hypothetical protein
VGLALHKGVVAFVCEHEVGVECGVSFRRFSCIAVLAVALAGCGQDSSVLFSSISPDGASELRLVSLSRSPREVGSFVQAQLITANGSRTLHEWYRNDLGFSFASAAWNPGASMAEVVWNDPYHGTVIAAWNTHTGKAVESESIRSDLANRIRAEYKLAVEVDPIQWVATSEAAAAFNKIHSRRD